MRAQQNEVVTAAVAELMARRGRILPLPCEQDIIPYDPEDARVCSQIASKEVLKTIYRDKLPAFAKLVNDMKLSVGKDIIGTGQTELGNAIISKKFSQDEMYDMMFEAMDSTEEDNG